LQLQFLFSGKSKTPLCQRCSALGALYGISDQSRYVLCCGQGVGKYCHQRRRKSVLARGSAVQLGVIHPFKRSGSARSSSSPDTAGPLSSLVIGTRFSIHAIYHWPLFALGSYLSLDAALSAASRSGPCRIMMVLHLRWKSRASSRNRQLRKARLRKHDCGQPDPASICRLTLLSPLLRRRNAQRNPMFLLEDTCLAISRIHSDGRSLLLATGA